MSTLNWIASLGYFYCHFVYFYHILGFQWHAIDWFSAQTLTDFYGCFERGMCVFLSGFSGGNSVIFLLEFDMGFGFVKSEPGRLELYT